MFSRAIYAYIQRQCVNMHTYIHAYIYTYSADEERLLRGERVQIQSRNGRLGTGMVVVAVPADIGTVFAVLTDLERYAHTRLFNTRYFAFKL